MRSLLWSLLLVVPVALWSSAEVPACQTGAPPAYRWYGVGKDGQLRVNLYLFYSDSCPRCADARVFTDYLRRSFPWVNVEEYEIHSSWENLDYYRRLAESLNQTAGQVPAFFYGGKMHIGYDSYELTGARIRQELEYCHKYLKEQMERRAPKSSGLAVPAVLGRVGCVLPAMLAWVAPPTDAGRPLAPDDVGAAPDEDAGELTLPELELPDLSMADVPAREPLTVELPLLGRLAVDELSLPVLTAVIGLCDAFNPCAFFVLLSLLSLLVHARSPWRMLFIGGLFVFVSGLFYFLFMAAWLNLFLLVGHLWFITAVAGVVAVLVSLVNIKDYFWLRQGPTLSIPDSAKPGLFARMRGLLNASNVWSMAFGAATLAVAANSYELLCTSGFPMVYTRALTLHDLTPAGHYGYLLLYNLLYVLPLALIVLAFTCTLGSRKLQEHEGRVLKLLSGLMMLLLGVTLLLRPEWLHSVGVAVALLALSVLGTAVILGVGQLCHVRQT